MASTRELQELWTETQELRAIDDAFKRSRLLGLLRRFLSLWGAGLPTRDPVASSSSGAFEIRLSDIAGLAGDADPRGLPPMPRGLAATWRVEWQGSSGEEGREPLLLRQVSGYWFLEGGLRELVRVEIIRARGEATIAARWRTAAYRPHVAKSAAGYPCPVDGDRIAS